MLHIVVKRKLRNIAKYLLKLILYLKETTLLLRLFAVRSLGQLQSYKLNETEQNFENESKITIVCVVIML